MAVSNDAVTNQLKSDVISKAVTILKEHGLTHAKAVSAVIAMHDNGIVLHMPPEEEEN